MGGIDVSTAGEMETNDPSFVVKSWRTIDGLPQNSVLALAQTDDGYLWLGTRGGLVRFDGVRLTTYGLNDGLRSLTIWKLLNDGQGGLWIGTTGGGLSHWRNGVITTLTTADGLAHNDVTALAPAEAGAVWVGTRSGLQHWGPDGFTRVAEAEGLRKMVMALAPSKDGGLWVSVWQTGLYYCQAGHCQEVQGPPAHRQLFGYALLVDKEGDLWVSIGNGIVLRRHADEWTEFNQTSGLPFSYITCLGQGPAGEIWAGSQEEGLFVFRADRFHAVRGVDASIRSVQAGSDGVAVWVGTRTGGLCRLTPQKLKEYLVGQQDRRGQPGGLVEAAPGQFWVTTFGGGAFHGRLDRLEPVLDVPALERWLHLTTGLRMSDGTVYLAGASVLARRDAGTGEFSSVTASNITLQALCEGVDGSLWAGTSDGELKQLVNGGLQTVTNGVFPTQISGLVRGPGAALWLATHGAGLFRWDAGRVQRWTTTAGLPTDVLRALYQDGEGTLWVGTAGGGLAWLQNGSIHSVNTRQGLGDNVISQILEDDQGNLWLGCNRGIFRVAKRELQDVAAGRATAVHPLALDESDGMSVAECTGGYSPAGLRSQSGKLYFSTLRSVVAVDPTQFGSPPSPPAVLIEEAKLDGKTIPMFGGVLTLPPGARELQITYTAFNYAKPEQIRFHHRLVGGDEQWVEGMATRSVRFFQLRPGDYTFQVSAANQDGRWQEPGASLAFTVQPFYWQTGWFRFFIVLLLLGSVGGIVWRVVRARLRRSEFRKAILDSVGAHIAVLDRHGVIVAVNERWKQFTVANSPSTGEPARNLGLGANYLEVCRQGAGASAESAKAAHDGIQAVFAGRMKSFYLEYACDSPQQKRWFSMNVTPLGVAGQSVVVAHVDITERKRTEEANRNAHEMMTAIFNSVPGLLYLYTEEGRLILWNRQHEVMTGYTADELMNFRIEDWFDEENRLKLAQEFPKIFSEGYTQVEMSLILKNRQKMQVFATGSKLILDGKPHMVGIAVDITERKRAEDRFRLVVEASPAGIVLVDQAGRMALVNAAAEKIFGYARAELVGQSVELLMPERYHHRHQGQRSEFFAAPEARSMGVGRELFARRKDGTEFPVEIGLSPIQTEEGVFVLTVIVDVTARKQAEAEVQRQRAELAHLSRVTMLGELSGSMAHELNQPLTAILSNAQAAIRFLAHDTIDLDEVRDILKDIVEQGNRAGEVIRRLRLLLKKGEVQQQPLDLNDVVQEVLKLMRSDLVNQNVVAHTELTADLPSVKGDRVQLQQVLLNLVMNACDAMHGNAPADRQLVLRTELGADKAIHVSVSDCGVGLAPDKLEQVFMPFYTTKSHGLGLGLSVCRTIITAHGGNLWAASGAERGAVFCFTIPALEEAGE
jgi:PAS domain S-box-containing protein